MQNVLAALCRCEAVTFRRTAAELGPACSALEFEAAASGVRRSTGRCARIFQTVRVRAVVSTAEPFGQLPAVIEETEALRPVTNLLLDANIDQRIGWLRDSGRAVETVPRPPAGA